MSIMTGQLYLTLEQTLCVTDHHFDRSVWTDSDSAGFGLVEAVSMLGTGDLTDITL